MSAVPPPPSEPFDAAFWKAVNAALDEALECDDLSRPSFIKQLHARDPRLANEVRKLLGRAHAQTLVTDVIRRPRDGLTTELAPVLGDGGERGFDGLLQRALRAERARADTTRHAGELCGAWKLQEIIGVGGMGEVWLATRADGLYQAKVAVKFLRADGDAERFEARFAQERAVLARLNHPGIARLIDAGRLFGTPFLVLEYVEGKPLLNYVAEHATSVQARVELIREIGEAVSYAHSQLVVHRDLKPSNVLVSPGGHVKLLDFGVAGLLEDAEHDEATTSEATRIAGRGLTVEYAAPEQISGEATGVASDIYSLGSLAYHLLSGRRAHLPDKPGRAALEYAVLHLTPIRVSDAAQRHDHGTVKDNIPPPTDRDRLEGDIDAIIARAMRIDAADRYRTMEAFVADLTRWVERRPIAARREDRSYRTRLWLRRNWLPVGLAATLFVALGTGLAISLWQYERARAEATRANKTADYLVELLRGADPDVHGGKWPSVLMLIEQAQRDLSTKFVDEPNVEQQLAHNIATTLRRLSQFRDALPIAQRSVALSRQLYGENAEPTRRATILLADIMYWLDDTQAALPLLDQALGKGTPARPADWWREGLLLRANMLGELRRFDESHAEFDRYLRLVRGLPAEAWLTAEAEADRGLTLAREGKRDEALAVQKKHRTTFENPPPGVKRIALNALMNLASQQVLAGDPGGVEALLLSVLRQWDELAGRSNAHSLEALSDLGLFYARFDQPQSSLNAYQDRLSRLTARAPFDQANVLFNQLDLLEVRARFFMLPKSAIAAEADRLAAEFAVVENIQAEKKSRFARRLAFVRMTIGDARDGTELVKQLPPAITDPSVSRAESAWRLLMRATVSSLDEDHAAACKTLAAARTIWSPGNNDYAQASLKVRLALVCTLANDPGQAELLTVAIASIPRTLPVKHRLRIVVEYVRELQSARSKTDMEAALARFARSAGVPDGVELNPVLPGLIF
jgi:serine/threonine-protein kinase